MKKRQGKPKLADCSDRNIKRALNKLGGFFIKEGSKHTRIVHQETNKCSTIPRSMPINKNIMKSFVNDYLIKELGYSDAIIYQYLWC